MFSKLGSKVCHSLRNGPCRYNHAWSETAQKTINASLKTIEEEGTWKKERIITGRQGAHIRVEHKDSQVINFCANNYLGLSVCTLYNVQVQQLQIYCYKMSYLIAYFLNTESSKSNRGRNRSLENAWSRPQFG